METKRLKKDRTKLSESLRLNNNNENLENLDGKEPEENDLAVYNNFDDKDLDIKNGKKKLKFEKKGNLFFYIVKKIIFYFIYFIDLFYILFYIRLS